MSSDPPAPNSLKELFPLDDGPGPAQPIRAERAEALVRGALDAWQAERGLAEPAGASLKPPRRRAALAAFVALGVAGAAAAAGYTLLHSSLTPMPVLRAVSQPLGGRPLPSAASAPEIPAVPEASAAPESPPEELRSAPASSSEAAPKAPHSRASGRQRDEAEEPPAQESAAAEAIPQDWLRQANQLRASGRYAEAEQIYAKVYRTYPRSASAYVARVAAANIRLEHLNDADGARRLYQAAEKGGKGGALEVEIRSGEARASRKLGEKAAEIEALRALIAAHPGSRAAERARARLTELGAR
jgi:tetratricopeptide (TPR) repeat protein